MKFIKYTLCGALGIGVFIALVTGIIWTVGNYIEYFMAAFIVGVFLFVSYCIGKEFLEDGKKEMEDEIHKDEE